MRFDLRAKIFTAYAVVLMLGATLATLVFVFGGHVLDKSHVLVREDVPRLEDISTLKDHISEQVTVLYEYYATRDRRAFLQQYKINNGRIGALETIDKLLWDGQEYRRISESYERIRALANALDGVLSARDVDWDRARELLSRVSAEAAEINRSLGELAVLVKAEVRASGQSTETAVSRMRALVILLSAAIFVISLFVGYHVNAYIADQAERRRLAMFPERNPNPVLRLSLDGEVVYANPGAVRLLQDMGTETSAAALLPPDIRARLSALQQSTAPSAVWEYPVGDRTMECGVHFLPDLECFHVYVTDITQRKRAEAELVHQAYHDALTDLPNRRMLSERLDHVLHAPNRHGPRIAVLMMELDRLTAVIDGLGHEVADALLQAVSARLKQVSMECREFCGNAVLYRFEGDVFALMIPGFASAQTPVRLAEQILQEMRRPLHVDAREFFLSFSIGMGVFPMDGEDAVTLLRNADTALQRARQSGGSAFQCYSADMNAHAAEWLSLESQLRHALERDELRLFYQPQIDVRTGRLLGMEALLRWQHPERGLLPPGEFIALAEETGLIVPIGEWVMRTGCAQNKAWRDRGLGEMTVAVNISARQFHRQDLPALVARALAQTGLSPDGLELEITESVSMQDVERTTTVLTELKTMGVKLSVDDFGTGFSSLNYLKRFPIDKLKIDQSFVRNLATDENDAAIARAIITLGHSLKLKVIAEGVETSEQLAWLRREDCDDAQGYLFGKPVPANQFEAGLRKPEMRRKT
jgi:diguanylate cyclase (GGDEF)-like protein